MNLGAMTRPSTVLIHAAAKATPAPASCISRLPLSDTSTTAPSHFRCYAEESRDLIASNTYRYEHPAVALLPTPPSLSSLAYKGARVVSALVQILQKKDDYWGVKDLIRTYIVAFELGIKAPDNLDLLKLSSVRTFVQKHRTRNMFRLDPGVNKKTLIADLGEEDLKEIAAIAEIEYRV
ncbi:hypothetical protein BGZ59_003575 [Podila verticillata]|nr:hypothetical protein BGZ59_003575 [Podila verticillata]KFH63722.1 hypothetical protein MVEG_10415 [Podila verticillata NRRL 6337]